MQRNRKNSKRLLTSEPPVLKNRLNDGLFCIALFALFKHIIGLFFSAIFLCILMVLFPFLLPAWIIRILCTKLYGYSRSLSGNCDIWWPFRRKKNFQAVIFFESNIEFEAIKLQIQKCFAETENSGCGCRRCDLEEQSEQLPVVELWDQKQNKFETLEDLLLFLNLCSKCAPHNHLSNVIIVTNFSKIAEDSETSSLAFFSHKCENFEFCLPRFLSLCSDGQMVFDLEPRMGDSFSPPSNNINPIVFLCNCLARMIQFTCLGPLTVFMLRFRKPNLIWKQAIRDVSNTPVNRYSRSGDEEVVLIESKIPKNSVVTDQIWYRWLNIVRTDQLLRAERVMRAASIELLLALVAGALRRHFRSLGIVHPPDITVAMPISCREFIPIEAQKQCSMILLPMQIPCGVEGAIPRVWAIQRRLAGALDGVLPFALRIFRFISDFALSPNVTRKLFASLYGDTSIMVNLLRAGGDLRMESNNIESMLLFPSLPPMAKAAFCFVQCEREIILCFSLDRYHFPDPDKIVRHFEVEIRCFLDQLAMRLLTLSQTTFLPNQILGCSDYSSVISDQSQQKPNSETAKVIDSENHSVHKLQLKRIQNELDDLKNCPQMDKSEYVSRLTELEHQLLKFHEDMTSRLGSTICATVKEDAEIVTNAVVGLLAPYREGSAHSGRRFSREFLRLDFHHRLSSVE